VVLKLPSFSACAVPGPSRATIGSRVPALIVSDFVQAAFSG